MRSGVPSMTIHATQLEEAIEYRDRLQALREFKNGFSDWQGDVLIHFGSYRAELSKCSHDNLMIAIEAETKMLRNSLDLLGVDYSDVAKAGAAS